ncbi:MULTISPECIES: ATP-grasp domain-containing protein [Gammaproteobacteria]|uniref:ATP-grasp domain-containing protein n=1 Tax=Gammaproteobacteria TaxID=1236 RepID=UPI0018664D2A|nr:MULTISPECIES: ATP-grasp domain-containing protein [Gammaproteobacteria]
MQIIYPDDYSKIGKPDEAFEQEYRCAKALNIHCLLLSSEDMALGKYTFSHPFKSEHPVIWRGWMLNKNEYQQLYHAVDIHGGKMLEIPEDYIRNHHITGWYEYCKKFTPETVIVNAETDFEKLTKQLQWPAYFVKDYVKSLTTTRGSIAKNADEIREILKLITQFRGNIEGGVSLRRVEEFINNSERRYFVLNKKIFSADNEIPELVRKVAKQINTPFYSIDIVRNTVGELRLVEIGDGQVSDIKEWQVEKLVKAFLLSGI